MSDRLDELLEFTSFTHKIREVERAIWVKDKEQAENNSEHSYQLALTALYIIEARQLKLDAGRCMALAIVHDILEVYSGDTPAFGAQQLQATKDERELAARAKLRRRWPTLTLLHELIDEYEARQTAESKFIYALDKILPIMNNYLDNGRTWKKDNITLQDHVAEKSDKVAADPEITRYYQELMELLKNSPELFPEKKQGRT